MDEALKIITTLLVEEVDKSGTSFGNYEEAKSRITVHLKTTSMVRKKKIVKKLKERFGEGGEEEDEEEDDKDDEEDQPAQALLALTQGQGEDQKEEVDHDEGAKEEEAN